MYALTPPPQPSAQHGSHSGVGLPGQQPAQGLTALLVMVAVLVILLAYFFWGAAWCRACCRRRFCAACPMDESSDCETVSDILATQSQLNRRNNQPTIILLPLGRMLVVDGAMFAQLQADSRGLDFIELGEHFIRNNTNNSSSLSVFQFDSETTSKAITPMFDLSLPPTYQDIFGSNMFINDLPPSYSQLNLEQINQMNLVQNRDICPIAEQESDRIGNSCENMTETTV